jgi:hypothetical protein
MGQAHGFPLLSRAFPPLGQTLESIARSAVANCAPLLLVPLLSPTARLVLDALDRGSLRTPAPSTRRRIRFMIVRILCGVPSRPRPGPRSSNLGHSCALRERSVISLARTARNRYPCASRTSSLLGDGQTVAQAVRAPFACPWACASQVFSFCYPTSLLWVCS